MRAILLAAALACVSIVRAAPLDWPPSNAALKDAVAAQETPAAPAAPSAAEWALRVVTYNIHGIVPWTSNDPKIDEKSKGRYREIAARLRRQRAEGKAPHVVLIQEAFNHWAAKAAREAGYPYVLEGNGPRFGKIGGSGLFILSEYPVFTSSNADYSDCTGFDCLANKGAMHARIVVPEVQRSFDVYNTHMNADEPPAKPEDSIKARMAQIRDYAAFVRRTREPGSAAVLAGDFNFKAGNADYALFRSLLSGTNVLEECARSACTGDAPGPILRDTVDHQFHLPGSRSGVAAVHAARTFTEPHGGEPLSDHWGLEARYRLLRPRRP